MCVCGREAGRLQGWVTRPSFHSPKNCPTASGWTTVLDDLQCPDNSAVTLHFDLLFWVKNNVF